MEQIAESSKKAYFGPSGDQPAGQGRHCALCGKVGWLHFRGEWRCVDHWPKPHVSGQWAGSMAHQGDIS